MEKKKHLRNPKILGLLRKGCSITFPSGVMLHRVPDTEFIEAGMMTETRSGLEEQIYVGIDTYTLNEEGLEEALQYEEFYADSLNDEEIDEYKEEGDWQ